MAPWRPKKEATSEEKLLARVASGDESALEDFYRRYFQRLYGYVFYRVGRDHHHTEEVVNDTFVEAVRRAGEYRAERGSVEAWLITLSRNRIRSLNSLMGKAQAYEKSWSMLDSEIENIFADLDARSLPESALESEELRALVTATMSSLPEGYSRLLEMKYISNLSVREIAAILKKTEKAVDGQLTRARLAFRETFKVLLGGMPA
ncbi:MAG: sigma-70 family RNA polymerase sigma factor [Planctomycetota bacterium]|nr:sigma-70 family RNA polymerase sigma factor [Planctomycetota bacterium]